MTAVSVRERRAVILHTNDIHGAIDQLARIATLVDEIRRTSPDPVFWLDAGDVEEQSERLSNVTKGVAPVRLLAAAGCDAMTAGNAAMSRYCPPIVTRQAEAVSMPLLLGNLADPDGLPYVGTQASVVLERGGIRLGVIGLTATRWEDGREMYDWFGAVARAPVEVVARTSRELRVAGVDLVVLLSHLGLTSDRRHAPAFAEHVDLVVGGHSHDLLPVGESAAGLVLVQAGDFGTHLGRVDVTFDGQVSLEASVVAVEQSIEPAPAVRCLAKEISAEVDAWLAEPVGQLSEPLELRFDSECGAGSFMADVLWARLGGDVALATAGSAFSAGLPQGTITRGALTDACPSPGNPAQASLTGAQLAELVRRGLDHGFAAETPQALRGTRRGLVHIAGGEIHDGVVRIGGVPLDPSRRYVVTSTDWELDAHGGYTDPDWGLSIAYDLSVILREAVEEYLRGVDGPLIPPPPRIFSSG